MTRLLLGTLITSALLVTGTALTRATDAPPPQKDKAGDKANDQVPPPPLDDQDLDGEDVPPPDGMRPPGELGDFNRPGEPDGPGGLEGPDRRGGPGPRPWRPGRSGPRGEGGPGPLPRLTSEQTDALLQFLETHFPVIGKRMRSLQHDDPAEFQRAIRRLMPRFWMLKEVYERDPNGLGKLMLEEHKLEEQIHNKAREYRRERDDGKKKQIGDELRPLLEQQWSIRLERRKLELADLEKRLQEQRKRLERYEAAKQQLIQRQFDRITGEGEIDW